MEDESLSFASGDLVWLESPQNPRGEIYDIASFKNRCPAGAHVVVDSTFSPPPLQFCLANGADMVMHSSTKFLGGHSDLLGGVLVVKQQEMAKKLKGERLLLGSVMGSMEAWLLLRSLRTLEVRVMRQSATATALAAWLNSETACAVNPSTPTVLFSPPPPGIISRVWHASLPLPSHRGEDQSATTSLSPTSPRREIASLIGPATASSLDPPALLLKQGSLPSGVLSIEFTSPNFARLACMNLKLFVNATSIGGVESLIEWRAAVDPKIDSRVCRVSVGLEAVEDLVEDLSSVFLLLSSTMKEKQGRKNNFLPTCCK